MAFDITKYMANNKIKAKEDVSRKKVLMEQTIHNVARENALDKLKSVKENIQPYSKEAIKHIDMAIKLIQQFKAK